MIPLKRKVVFLGQQTFRLNDRSQEQESKKRRQNRVVFTASYAGARNFGIVANTKCWRRSRISKRKVINSSCQTNLLFRLEGWIQLLPNYCNKKMSGRPVLQTWKSCTVTFTMRSSKLRETQCAGPAAASIMILDISILFQSPMVRFANCEWIHRLSLSIFRQELQTSTISILWLIPSESYSQQGNRFLFTSVSRVKRVSKTMFDLQNLWQISGGLDLSLLSCRAWRGLRSCW